jgi:hypothetical protein
MAIVDHLAKKIAELGHAVVRELFRLRRRGRVALSSLVQHMVGPSCL